MASINKRALLFMSPMCLFSITMAPPTSHAEFELNFLPHKGSLNDGGRSGSWGDRGQEWEFSDEDITQEMVIEDGEEYYHVIIKDQYQDFAMDFYIKTASGNGFYPDRSTGPASSSYGDGGPDLRNFENPFLFESGNGTGNPERMYMRMIVKDDQINQEFLKATLTQKPIIKQAISGVGFRDDTVIDMSNSNYGQINYTGSVDINTVVSDLDSSAVISEFNLNRDGEQATINAGEYSIEPGTGPGESFGTYDYSGGKFDVYSVDWVEFCEPSQNPQHNCNFDGSGRGSRGGHSSGGTR